LLVLALLLVLPLLHADFSVLLAGEALLANLELESCFEDLLLAHLLFAFVVLVDLFDLPLLLHSLPHSLLPLLTPLPLKITPLLRRLILSRQKLLLLHLQMLLSHMLRLRYFPLHFHSFAFS